MTVIGARNLPGVETIFERGGLVSSNLDYAALPMASLLHILDVVLSVSHSESAAAQWVREQKRDGRVILTCDGLGQPGGCGPEATATSRLGAGSCRGFVIICPGVMGGYKVLESFPLTEDGRVSCMALFRAVRSRRGGQGQGYARLPHCRTLGEDHDTQPVLVVTTNEVPGHRITQVHGHVFGLMVRGRNIFSNLGASFRAIASGEVGGYTKLLTDSRNQARERM
jgi:hypothetical protein